MKTRRHTWAVALSLDYFSKVSARLPIIQHEQAVHVKRRRHFLGVLFVCVGWLEVLAGILGYIIKLRCYFQCCFFKRAACYWLYALAKKNYSVIFQLKILFSMLFLKGNLLWLYALAKKLFSYFSIENILKLFL